MMKILWLSNVLFPEVCDEMNIEKPVLGGWMHSAAMALWNVNSNIQLAVASVYEGNEFRIIDKFNITYYIIPQNLLKNVYDKQHENYFREAVAHFQPNIVHIHGTEYPHSLAFLNACGSKNLVVSIQGLVSVYCKHYLGGLQDLKLTFRDIVRQDSIKKQQKQMEERGKMEIELLSKVNHIIGRTSWDKNNTWAVNPKATYHFCNETLRESFYDNSWKYLSCEAYSIFLSQAHYPIKGLQQLIKALPLIIKLFPETKVYVAGDRFIDKPRYKQNGFERYIAKELSEKNLNKYFIFLGKLSEKQMAERYSKSHVFVCPSAIENSPNSVGEAQLIGTPVVASYVGGTMDMVEHNYSGLLYRYEETSMLAYNICKLFENSKICERLSKNGKTEAQKRHDKQINASTLYNIYKSIIINHD